MFAVKTIFNMTTSSIGFVSNRILGNNTNAASTDLRHQTDSGNLYEPVLSTIEDDDNLLLLPSNINHAEGVEHDAISTTTTTTKRLDVESTPLLLPPSQQQPSLTSTDYMTIERSSQIIGIFVLHAILYYALSILGFCYLVESWSIIDALYYATVLFCTIGFGDIEPDNWYSQLYTIFLALYGVAFLGIVLGAVIDYCLEYQHVQSEQRRRTVGTRVLYQLKEQQQQQQQQPPNTNSSVLLEDETDISAPNINTITNSTNNNNNNHMPTLGEEIGKLILFEIPVVSFAILIAIGIGHYEGWTIFESIYWCVISGATIGFGDIYPRLTYVKLLCVLYLPFVVAVMGDLLGRIVTIYMDRKRRCAEQQFLSRSLTLVDLQIMDADCNGRVDKAEFLAYVLCALQKVSKDDITDILDVFRRLDVDQNDYLTKSDLIANQWEQSFQSSIQQQLRPSKQK
jgi:Ion channel